jgi:Arc/MetJ-type ribon-helix-helix transcriptional regulator
LPDKERGMKIELSASLEKMVREKVDAGDYPDELAVLSDTLTLMRDRDEAERRRASLLSDALGKGRRDFDEGRFVEFETEEESVAFFHNL